MRAISITLFLVLSNLSVLSQQLKGRGVYDEAGIALDSTVLAILKGEWGVKEAIQTLRDSVRKIEVRFWRVSFMDNNFFLAKACGDCITQEDGVWEVIEKRWIKITSNRDSRMRGDFELGGDWVVHEVTPGRLVLSKKLTTTGNWMKRWTFERVR